jgi:hypothetical protein
MPTQPDSEPSSPVRSHMCRGFRRRADGRLLELFGRTGVRVERAA